eukprot:4058563-Pyramimonas_sp.AAC.1
MILTLPPVLVPERHPLVTQGLDGPIPVHREVDLVYGDRKLAAAVGQRLPRESASSAPSLLRRFRSPGLPSSER